MNFTLTALGFLWTYSFYKYPLSTATTTLAIPGTLIGFTLSNLFRKNDKEK